MMKKVKSFNIGDKVFAKVKGYPAWPAKIVGANGKKYEVTFYGTMESGSIKVEDLFYYLKHKHQFYRNIKRKDYLEAFEQIEAEIKETGTDGNNEEDLDTSTVGEIIEKRGRKRSRESMNDEQQVKRLNNRISSGDFSESHEQEKSEENVTTHESDSKNSSQSVTRSGRIVKLKKFSDDEDEEITKTSTKNRKSISAEKEIAEQENNFNSTVQVQGNTSIKENSKQEVGESISQDQCSIKDEVEEKNSSNSNIGEVDGIENIVPENEEQCITDVNVIPIDYLETVIAYGDHVKSKADVYKKKASEHRDIQENEVVIAKLPSNKLIGIKYNRNALSGDNEYETALSESQEAKRVISIKDKLENGSVTGESQKDKLLLNIKLNEEEVQEKIESKSLERKKAKLKYLKTEASLVDSDVNIKSCLGLDKADPKKAYEYMALMMELDITPLMLKKHPLIVDVMKRLRRYIGNVKEWKLAGDLLERFEADAEKIRQKAEEVFVKFMTLFQVSDSTSFWEVFHQEVEKFDEETKDINEKELFDLCAEPNSRQAFFDCYEKKRDAEKLNKSESKDEPIEKENSSNIANTEQMTETQNNVGTP